MARYEQITKHFEQHFLMVPEIISHAPGRVNLIGDHTDYNDGFVLPAAINFVTKVAAAKRRDKQIIAVACDIGFQEVVFSLDDIKFDNQFPWSNYVRGVLKIMTSEYPRIRGINIMISGNVPQGAGLSSSAGFEIAVIKAVSEIYSLPIDGVQAALLGQKAENNFVGCNCGVMDQLISALGTENHAMFLDCRELTFKNAPIPETHTVLVINSNVKRGLADSEYNLRRNQCEAAAAFFKRKALRDVSVAELERAEGQLEPILYRRARHVISENRRTQEAYQCLSVNNIEKVSELMRQSHASLKNDFEVTTPELDFLADILNKRLGNQGGARMTGGGFGGCVVALAPPFLLSELTVLVTEAYLQKFDLRADVYQCSIVKGAYRS